MKITEETYNHLMLRMSRTEFDVCLLALLHSDWDGHLRIDLTELAKKAGTTKKYLKEILKKFTSHTKGRFVFSEVENREGLLYRVNIAKSNLFYKKGDKYCKNFKFFYTSEFQKLPINAKRLVLMAAFRLSTLKRNKVFIKMNDIIPAVHTENTLPFTKGRLLEAINVIQQSGIKEIVNTSIESKILLGKKEEMVCLEFAENTQNEFEENHTERELLRKKLFDAGYYDFLPDSYCIEIEKVASYIFNSFLTKEKELTNAFGPTVSAKDELQKLARFIYDGAIELLAPALQSEKNDLNEPKKVSAYFSAIVHELVREESFNYFHQAESIKSLIGNGELHQRVSKMIHGKDLGASVVEEEISPIQKKANFYERMYMTLKNWCEEWVISRVRKAESKKADETETTESIIQRLRTRTYEHVDTLTSWMNVARNKRVNKNELQLFLKDMKDLINTYLNKQKINSLKNKEKFGLPY